MSMGVCLESTELCPGRDWVFHWDYRYTFKAPRDRYPLSLRDYGRSGRGRRGSNTYLARVVPDHGGFVVISAECSSVLS